MNGRLAIVLHTHMPYVEGFGTWPFGEEWLWEAIATSYLPLLDVLDEAPGKVTLSLTPVLCDQLEAEGVGERFLAFLRDIRPESHRLDTEVAGDPGVVRELERSAALYESAAERFEARGGDLVAAFAPHVSWTSSATHAVLPLLATETGIRLQINTGIASHRARFGGWGGGFWLPECAHAPWLDEPLEEAGVHATCVDLSDVFGLGAPEQLVPLRSPAGPLLVPIDRATLELVWHPDGYPARPAYRDSHRLTEHRHMAWANDGSPYDPQRATEQARADAADFAARARDRLAGGGLCVCAVDTELLGHFWHEGPQWLAAAIDACDAAGVDLVGLDEALPEADAGQAPVAPELQVTSWGRGHDLSSWSGPGARGLAWLQRAAELRTLGGERRPSPRALRELLALQASDWAFGLTHETAGEYPRERAAGHAAELDAALAETGEMDARLRNLAPWLDLSNP